jgi:hypothetical protein
MSITQDRPCTCMFFFADGRRCQMPPSADDMGLCYFHAKKYHDHLTAQEAGQQINEFLSSDILTACDLSAFGLPLQSSRLRLGPTLHARFPKKKSAIAKCPSVVQV